MRKRVKTKTVLLIGKAFINSEVKFIIGGKFSYVVTWKATLFLFYSRTGSIAENGSVIDSAFILLLLFCFASDV